MDINTLKEKDIDAIWEAINRRHLNDKWRGWSWTEFWKGKLNNKLLAWIAYMTLQYLSLFSNKINGDDTGSLIMWTGIVTMMFMLHGAVDKAVSNAQIMLEGKFGFNKESALKRGNTNG